MTATVVCGALVLCLASCTSPDRVTVEDNELGITALEIEHDEQAGEPIVEVRGVDSVGSEVARFRSRVGNVADLEEIPNADFDTRHGKEITISVRGEATSRVTTRSTEKTDITASMTGPRAFVFLQLAAESLRHDIVVVENARPDVAYTTGQCDPGVLRPSPTAYGCCQWDQGTKYFTDFSNNAQRGSHRAFDGAIGACRTIGGGTCSGTVCVYGPCGAKPPAFSSFSPYVKVVDIGSSCQFQTASAPGQNSWGDGTGYCPYTGCINGVPVTGGAGSGSGYWEYY